MEFVRTGRTIAVTDSAAVSFRRFYDAEIRAIFAELLALTGDRWAAEDLTQEAFTRAYRDWQRVSTYERPGAWVRTVAINLATSRFRRLAVESRALTRLRGRRRHDQEPIELPDETFWAEVRRLPRRQAEAVVFHYVHDLSIADIAVEMGCAQGTAKAHLHRARLQLAERLGLSAKEGDR